MIFYTVAKTATIIFLVIVILLVALSAAHNDSATSTDGGSDAILFVSLLGILLLSIKLL